jgi:hypothetical protein
VRNVYGSPVNPVGRVAGRDLLPRLEEDEKEARPQDPSTDAKRARVVLTNGATSTTSR